MSRIILSREETLIDYQSSVLIRSRFVNDG
jgi:hypothetical protein